MRLLWIRCSTRDADAWQKMSALKSKILSFWDTTPVGVRLNCIKFAQKVVLAQSKGTTDPRVWTMISPPVTRHELTSNAAY